jgi:hypothetical protein
MTSSSLAAGLAEFNFSRAFQTLKSQKYCDSAVFAKLPLQSKKLILLLTAIRVGASSIEQRCDRTGLGLHEVSILHILGQKCGLLNTENRLTTLGTGTLDALATSVSSAGATVTNRTALYYYPKQLRVP